MNNFVFYSPTEFVFGKDTDIQTGTLAKKYNARKAMIVYGGGSIIRSGLLQRIEDSLQQAGVDYVKLGGVQPNPTDPKVYEGIELARKDPLSFTFFFFYSAFFASRSFSSKATVAFSVSPASDNTSKTYLVNVCS